MLSGMLFPLPVDVTVQTIDLSPTLHRSINFSFCSIQYNRPPAEYLSPTSRATRQPRTIQEMLRQFPAARYLEIDLSRPELSDAVMDEMLNDRLHIMESGIPISSLPLISPEVTSIVLPSDRHLVRLAIAIPLPSLVRLHVSKEISVCDIPGPSQMLQFRSIFHEWQTIPALWPSLGSVQVCLRVLLAPSLDRLRLFNIWVRWQVYSLLTSPDTSSANRSQ
jgi:hypothetical protein